MDFNFNGLQSNSKGSRNVWNWNNILIDIKANPKNFETVFNVDNINFLKKATPDEKKGKNTPFYPCRRELQKLRSKLISNIRSDKVSNNDKLIFYKSANLFWSKYVYESFDIAFYNETKKNISDFIKFPKK